MNIHNPPIAEIIAKARAQGRTALDEATGKALLHRFGIRAPRSAIATSAVDAEAKAARLTAPFVVKVVSPEILHKSDAGGVALNLTDPAAVRLAVEAMAAKPAIAKARVDGWLVEEMVPPGREMVIGGFCDPQFGPMIMIGFGGIFVEILKDVSFRICPISRAEAQSMLAELKGYSLLSGARGHGPVDEEGLVDAMLSIGGEGGLLMTLRQDMPNWISIL